MLSKLMQRWGQEYAADHGGHGPVDLIWLKSYEWEWKHDNIVEIESHEPDLEKFGEACELFASEEIEQALNIWFELAEHGSARSMYEIGLCYQYGGSVSIDPIEAQKWFERAFAKGSQAALLRCAWAAASRQDYSACEEILKVGVDQDWAPAIFWLAWYKVKQSTDKASYQTILPLLRKAAKRGHPAANFFLTNFMVRGKFGVACIPLGFLRALGFGVASASSSN